MNVEEEALIAASGITTDTVMDFGDDASDDIDGQTRLDALEALWDFDDAISL